MAGARAILFLGGCGMFLFIALAIGIGVAVFFMHRRRIMGAIGIPARAVAILEEWAGDEGYELLKAEWPKDLHDHPFTDRFGAGFGKRPAIVLVINVRTPEGETRRGWAYLQYQGIYMRILRPDSLEVIWDE